MGANGSSEAEEFGLKGGRYGISHLPQGKPGTPEGKPKVTEITHNSVTLTWKCPMHSGKILAYQVEYCDLQNHRWKIVTSTCQGCCYTIRNLSSDTQFMFRVRAENVHGQSKPSQVSETITTRPVPTNYLEEKPRTKLVRRHSHYLKVDSRVSSILTRTDDEIDAGNSVGSIPFRRNSTRGSLPPSFRTKRTSVTSIMPGAKRESVCSFQESKKSIEEQPCAEEEALNIKRISTSSTEASSLFSSNSMTSIAEDEELQILYGQRDSQMCSDNDDAYSTTNSHSTTSSQYSSSSSRSCRSTQSYHSSDHCVHNITNNINLTRNLMQNLSDDTKMEFLSNTSDNRFVVKTDSSLGQASTTTNKVTSPPGKSIFDICNNEIWEGRKPTSVSPTSAAQNLNRTCTSNRNTLDLRSLRQLLNSQDVMVKTHDPNIDNIRRCYPSSIQEQDEDGVTLDIVSTI